VDLTVERNAYGRQLDSRVARLATMNWEAKRNSRRFFIRAPIIRRVGKGARVLAHYQDDPVLVECGPHLVATFIPSSATTSASTPTSSPRWITMKRRRVLFVCVGNAFRSQMAEGFMRTYGGREWEVASAGVSPAGYLPGETVSMMAEKGIDVSGQFPKTLDEVLGSATT
jgi:hypothetical protein